MATCSSILAWRIPRTEESGRLYSPWGHRVRLDWATNTHTRSHYQHESYFGPHNVEVFRGQVISGCGVVCGALNIPRVLFFLNCPLSSLPFDTSCTNNMPSFLFLLILLILFCGGLGNQTCRNQAYWSSTTVNHLGSSCIDFLCLVGKASLLYNARAWWPLSCACETYLPLLLVSGSGSTWPA